MTIRSIPAVFAGSFFCGLGLATPVSSRSLTGVAGSS